MIGCYFSGRLGNQLFRYAFVRRLWAERGGRDALLFNFRRVESGVGEGFVDSLRHFRVLPYVRDDRSLVLRHGTVHQRCIYGAYRFSEAACRRLSRRCDVSGAYRERLLRAGIVVLGSGDGDRRVAVPPLERVFVNGFFENRMYFDAIRPILLRELVPCEPPLAGNARLYARMAECESVCVSVRRGDYLSSTYRDGFYVCDADYFVRAMAAIRKRVPNPQFVFFSDDIDWVRQQSWVPSGSLFEHGDDPVWEKLRLMSSCKHFIISNSSFSWWAQYLGQYAGKVVVSPRHWFNRKDWVSHLVEDDFVKC
ncbi:MAG: alpha-1,2-fucosyltransferase [Bacteroidaceae bacterium]|nr:alpha-1,2-fucosyltransferase [Bacteroidaceae bacterium]